MRKKTSKRTRKITAVSTTHGFVRTNERVMSLSEKENLELIVHARKKGLSPIDFKGTDFYSYIMNKVYKRNKKIKICDGYIFIFFLNSKRLITMYEIPSKFLNSYFEVLKKKDLRLYEKTIKKIERLKQVNINA